MVTILNSEEVVNPLPFCVTETVRSDYDMTELKIYLNSVLDYKGLEKRCENFIVDDNK